MYFPTLGRFASVDPIPGGTANNYVYALDPVNQSDYSGQFLGLEKVASWIGDRISDLQAGVHVVATKTGEVLKAVVNPTPAKAKSRTSSGPNLPLGQSGKVDLKKLSASMPLGKHLKTYSSSSAGGSFFAGGDYSIVQAEDGTMYHSVSKGVSLKPGVDLSSTGGFGDPTLGCAFSVSASIGVEVNASFSGGWPSFEIGLGMPGASAMQVCTYKGLTGEGIL